MKRIIHEVHVEHVGRLDVYASLKQWALKNPKARLMLMVDLCPSCNFILLCHLTQIRFAELSKSSPIGLHVHLSLRGKWSVTEMSYEQQYNMLKTAVEYLKECGLTTSHFAAGHFDFNKDSINACHELGLTNFHYLNFRKDKLVVEWAKKEYPNMVFISAVKVFTHDITIHSKRL